MGHVYILYTLTATIIIVLNYRCHVVNCEDFVEVTTRLGKIRGYSRKTRGGLEYNAYLGVRYADFNGRFKKAIYPPSPIEGVYDATEFAPKCYQPKYYELLEQNYTEDCLTLDIYAPTCGEECLKGRPLPVVVGIHGGGFGTGSSAFIPGDAILDAGRDVIFVSIQYRLGIFGLLTTGDDIAPGSLLYWDQHYAIRWIHDNIAAFGGNPAELTVWGYSAGGSSSMAQVLHEGNQGLIKRAIVVTAPATYSCMSEWSCNKRSQYIQQGKDVAKSMGCPTKPSWAMVECLSKVDPQKLSKASTQPDLEGDKPSTEEWMPVIDGEFLDDVPYQLFKKGRSKGVDLMHGFGYHDTGYFLLNWLQSPETSNKEEIHNFYRAYYSGYGIGDVDAFIEAMVEHFGEDVVYGNPVTESSIMRDNDRARVTPHILDLKYHDQFVGTPNNYLYVFDHHSTFSDSPEWLRGEHVETCVFTFGIGLGFPDFFNTTAGEKRLMDDLLRYQLNFAKTGDPNFGAEVPTHFPRWDMESRKLLRFQEKEYIVDKDAYKGVEDFWETLVSPKDSVDKDTLCVKP